jgi:protocatechuate 3,4-dioxygenase beta subunit
MDRLGRLLLAVALGSAGAGCAADDGSTSSSPTSLTSTSTPTTSQSATAASTAVSEARCPPTPFGASVDESATVTLGPAPGIPETRAPGEPLTIVGTAFTSSCEPLAGVTIHVWQTDGDGVYGPGHGTEELDCCFLQGTVRSAPDGRFQLRTSRPGHYKGAQPSPPAHIHIEARHAEGDLMSEIVFADDPYLTNPDADGYVVVTVEQGRAVADIVLS